MEKLFLTPKEASKYLKCDPFSLNLMAKRKELPFPYILVGRQLKIPTKPFLNWLGIDEDEQTQQEVRNAE